MRNRNLSLILLFILISILPAINTYIVDPYQYFHRSYFAPDLFIKREGRMQIAGVIKNYIEPSNNIDTIVAGASLAENYDTELVPKIFKSNKKAINLSIAGGFVSEQITVVEKALDTGKIKNVFWSIATHWYQERDKIHPFRFFPKHLYNNSTFDDLNYLYANQTHKASLRYLITLFSTYSNASQKNKSVLSPYVMLPTERLGSWAPWNEKEMEAIKRQKFNERYKAAITKRFSNTEHLIENGKIKLPDLASLNSGAFKTEEEVLAYFFIKYPNVNFVLVMPPVSNFYYHTISQQELETAIHRPIILSNMVSQFPNAKLYGFNDDYIINDLRNYRDVAHFDLGVSRFIIQEIARDKNRITKSNAQNFVLKLKNSIIQFNRLEPFNLPDYQRKISFSGGYINQSN